MKQPRSMRKHPRTMLACGLAGLCLASCDDQRSEPETRADVSTLAPAHATETQNRMDHLLEGRVRRIDGTPQDLAEFRGKVVLIVNVASQCGLTGQYAGLQSLYETRRDRGLVVLGFPANNFMGQEPGGNAEIQEFCVATYGVNFPMFEKIDVIDLDDSGPRQAHPLFKSLTESAAAKLTQEERAAWEARADRPPGVIPGSPSWNFTKYLIARDGTLEARFDPQTKPDDPAFVAAIDGLLDGGTPPG